MTDDDYMHFFTSCKMIDAGQVGPTVPEHHGARLESLLASRPRPPQQENDGMSSCREELSGHLQGTLCTATPGAMVPWQEQLGERNGSRTDSGGLIQRDRGGKGTHVTKVLMINGW